VLYCSISCLQHCIRGERTVGDATSDGDAALALDHLLLDTACPNAEDRSSLMRHGGISGSGGILVAKLFLLYRIHASVRPKCRVCDTLAQGMLRFRGKGKSLLWKRGHFRSQVDLYHRSVAPSQYLSCATAFPS
jgi:hypothetical protein